MARRLEIDGWASGLRFSACHVIPGHDKCGRLHGHTYAVHIRIRGRPNDKHIIADFGAVKDMLRDICEELDHRVILPSEDPRVTLTKKGGNVEVVIGDKSYSFPEGDVVVLDVPSATAEVLARYILDRVSRRLRADNVEEVEVGLDEGAGQGAWARDTF